MAEQNARANNVSDHLAAESRASAAQAATAAESAADTAVSAAGVEVDARTRQAARIASQAVDTGRESVRAVSKKAAVQAANAWTVLRANKAIAVGAGAGVAVAGACYAAGRRAAGNSFGPVTRLTHGRI